MSTLVSKSSVQILKADEAKKSGHFDSWIRGLTSAACVKGCAATIVPNHLIHDMIQVSLNKAHEIVANDQANRLAKIEGEGERCCGGSRRHHSRTYRPDYFGDP